MKKEMISMAIMAAGLLVASCGNKSEAPVAEAEQAEQVVEETIPEEQPASLADIVANAKEAGAQWTTDEWKDAFKKALLAYKPFAVAMNEAKPAELENITKQYVDFPALIKEFARIASESEGGKAIDNEWIEATMQELGVPHL